MEPPLSVSTASVGLGVHFLGPFAVLEGLADAKELLWLDSTTAVIIECTEQSCQSELALFG